MANTKISALTALTGADLANDDAFAVVDTSAVATKSITVAELKLGIMPAPGPIGGTTPSTGAFTTLSATTGAAVGGATAGTGGLAFPATAVAVADANTLDDYEEGSFTPTIVGTSTAGTGTYSVQVGTYTKVGRVVNFKLYLVWSAHDGTGNMRVALLPFTPSATANTNSAVTVYMDSAVTLTASNVIQGYVPTGAAIVILTQYAAGGGASASIPIDTAAGLMISGHYEV